MSSRLYIRVRGQVQGPYDDEHLRSLARRGLFSRIHEVSEDGRFWVRAEEYVHLFIAVTPTKPSAVTGVKQTENVLPDTPTDAKVWYYSHGVDDDDHGPVDFEYLQMMVSAGKLGQDDLVWKDPMPEWMPIRSVAGLRMMEPVAKKEQAVSVDAGSRQAGGVSSLAVVSLILSVLWLGGLGSLAAIVLGILALRTINRSGGALTGRGLALTGISLGITLLTLTVFGAIAIWAEMATG